MKILPLMVALVALSTACCDCVEPKSEGLIVQENDYWTFVSMPDFLNVDTDYPQSGWEESLNYILSSINKEDPDFLLVPGDLLMGHWDGLEGNDSVNIHRYAKKYYSAWKNRLNAHGLPYYTAVGDHDIGDNPWDTEDKFNAVRHYKTAFRENMQMPDNGPEHMKGTAFWWKYRNVLFISLDVFEEGEGEQGRILPGVTGEQLSWLKNVLDKNRDVNHTIVMGHVPVLGPVRLWSSSGLMLNGGAESLLWKTLSEYQVDAYLCGEVHAVTCTDRKRVLQIAHGGLVGYNTMTSYLVVHVTEERLYLEIKEIPLKPYGEHLWQTKDNRPLENLSIDYERFKGGTNILGQAILDKSQGRNLNTRWGYFEERFATSNDRGVSVFRNDGNQNLTIACPN